MWLSKTIMNTSVAGRTPSQPFGYGPRRRRDKNSCLWGPFKKFDLWVLLRSPSSSRSLNQRLIPVAAPSGDAGEDSLPLLLPRARGQSGTVAGVASSLPPRPNCCLASSMP